MSIFASIPSGSSLDAFVEHVLLRSGDRFGGNDEDEEDVDLEDGFVDASVGEAEDEDDLEDGEEDLDDFEEISTTSTPSATSSSTTSAHTASTKKKAKKKGKKKKKTCSDHLKSIQAAKTRMWSYNLGDPEREHWEKIAIKRREKMARAGCSGVPLI